MKLRILVSFGEYPSTPFRPGDVIDAPEADAKRWIASKYAVALPVAEHAVRSAPETTSLATALKRARR